MPLSLLVSVLLLQPQAPARSVEGNLLISTDRPSIRIELDSRMRYIGTFQIPLKKIAKAERFLFAEVSRDRGVKRLFIAQFESFLPNSRGMYRFPMREPVKLGQHEYSFNTWFYNCVDEAAARPGTEGEATLRFLREKGLRLDAELMMARYARVAHDDRRSEVIIFYQEPLAPTGLNLADADQESPSPDYSRVRQAFVARALASFRVVEG